MSNLNVFQGERQYCRDHIWRLGLDLVLAVVVSAFRARRASCPGGARDLAIRYWRYRSHSNAFPLRYRIFRSRRRERIRRPLAARSSGTRVRVGKYAVNGGFAAQVGLLDNSAGQRYWVDHF